MDESSYVVEGLLYATCHSPAEVVAHLSETPKHTLEATVNAVEKYGMETRRTGIRLAFTKQWDFSQPLNLLEKCAWWRDPAAIAVIFGNYNFWSGTYGTLMQPWMLPAHIVSDMGVPLYRMLVEACVKSTNCGRPVWEAAHLSSFVNWDVTTTGFIQSTNEWEGSF
jgi:hypothetical protein